MMDYTQIFLPKIENIKFKGKRRYLQYLQKKFIKKKKAPSKFHDQYLLAEANLELLP